MNENITNYQTQRKTIMKSRASIKAVELNKLPIIKGNTVYHNHLDNRICEMKFWLNQVSSVIEPDSLLLNKTEVISRIKRAISLLLRFKKELELT